MGKLIPIRVSDHLRLVKLCWQNRLFIMFCSQLKKGHLVSDWTEGRAGLSFVHAVPWLAAVAGNRGQGTHLNAGLGFPSWKRVSPAQCSVCANPLIDAGQDARIFPSAASAGLSPDPW